MRFLLACFPLIACAHTCLVELPHELPVVLECTGKHRIQSNDSSGFSESRFAKKAPLEATELGLSWGDDSSLCDNFSLEAPKSTRILINGSQYSGRLDFRYGKKIINHVDIDLLVQNMLEKKAFQNFHLETLKALAITLRTDLASDQRILKASELSYEGSSLLYQYPKIAQAIVDTRHRVMTLDGQTFTTTYTLDSAGSNASFKDIFRQNAPSPKGTKLPASETKTWKKQFSKDQICQNLSINTLKNLSFYKDKASGKIYAVKIADEKGPRVLLIERFMELLGLESNDFDLNIHKTSFNFVGKGQGLGVGLCLKTAEKLAQSGASYQDILKACYPDINFGLLE